MSHTSAALEKDCSSTLRDQPNSSKGTSMFDPLRHSQARPHSHRARRDKQKASKHKEGPKHAQPALDEHDDEWEDEDEEEGEEDNADTQPTATRSLPIRSKPKPSSDPSKKGKRKKAESLDKKQDGVRFRLEMNLDMDLELKASIRGDVALALLS